MTSTVNDIVTRSYSLGVVLPSKQQWQAWIPGFWSRDIPSHDDFSGFRMVEWVSIWAIEPIWYCYFESHRRFTLFIQSQNRTVYHHTDWWDSWLHWVARSEGLIILSVDNENEATGSWQTCACGQSSNRFDWNLAPLHALVINCLSTSCGLIG